jgi:hypothetical protein
MTRQVATTFRLHHECQNHRPLSPRTIHALFEYLFVGEECR